MLRTLRPLLLLALATAVAGCGLGAPFGTPAPAATAPTAAAPATTAPPTGAASQPGRAPFDGELVPPDGRAWFGMNLDWANVTVAEVSGRLGATPATWVQFVRFPLDDGGRANLDGFYEQVGAAGGIGVVTLEPHDGLSAVTREAADALADVLTEAWEVHGVATIVRFAHEMNGSWYPWGQQPAAYVDAFRLVAEAVGAAPAAAMLWAPNEGSGYPFTGGAHGATPDRPDFAALDTNGDGALTGADDPYAPYWPGADVVDWVGMSVYFWGLEYPWGENEIAPPDRFSAQLTGRPTGAHAGEVAIPDFYATYAEGQAKPMAIVETAALFDPAGDGPDEAAVKRAWFEQVLGAGTRERFDRIGMVNWFEWHKVEPEVGRPIDWRLSGDADLARDLLAGVPEGWLAFARDE